MPSAHGCGRPKLYFVKLDVQACFDSIDQTKLLQILRQIISEVLRFEWLPVHSR